MLGSKLGRLYKINARVSTNLARHCGRRAYATGKSTIPTNIKPLALGASLIVGSSIGYYIGQLNGHDVVSTESTSRGSTVSLQSLEPVKYCEDIDKVITKLKEELNNNEDKYSVVESNLAQHTDTYFNTHHAVDAKSQVPLIILYPETTEEVSKLVKICNDNHVPMIPFGGGTSLEGHFMPTRGPHLVVTIDVSKYMNNVVALHKDDLDVTVQAGVPWEDLNDYLEPHGLMFGCDPGPGALIGGCIANSCSGTNAFKYGTMKENVVSLTVVLPDGTVVKTKNRPRKSSAGYNLNGLFTGSEGTLGIITEATVKCHVKDKFESIAVVSFKTIRDAAACSSELIQRGIKLNAMELLDDSLMRIINKSESTDRNDWVEEPTMFFKIAGRTQNSVNDLIKEVQNVAKETNSTAFQFANSVDEKLELWEARKVALWSVIDAAKSAGGPNAKVWTTDVAVPISQFATVINDTKSDILESGLTYGIVGHAGDGNFHCFIVYNSGEEENKCHQLVDNMVTRALKAEGTCTGEHGIGLGKRDYLSQELGQEPIDLMRAIKMAIDPHRVMNPDKIFPIDPSEPNL
ncbi:D-lactate dehydrogenase [cytochrome] 1, mitochondrial [Nakaseomyces glabratus]|nr:D-lactate dehydrogenase [cytochrome] 1, mitochondrial [Nakaseomyces glabratus]KTB25639.1 D-lactate dehydrogenase [cytochrome] 1, mitochondrial [Nakaseomyces glabratus]